MLFIRKLHKWLGLVVGLQLLLWTTSGTVFAWLDHHEVSAEHSVKVREPIALPKDAVISSPDLQSIAPSTLFAVRLMPLLDDWMWRIESSSGVELRRASDGQPLRIDQSIARKLATRAYAGVGTLQSVEFQPESSLESREAGATWKASFNDEAQTAFYFSADDGRLVVVRNDAWRLFDFFWMLHTMDYPGRDNFNNPLIITVGTSALWLTISGFILLFKSFRREDFGLTRR
jgi:hypothetical protein